jgi:hypothetical protein
MVARDTDTVPAGMMARLKTRLKPAPALGFSDLENLP